MKADLIVYGKIATVDRENRIAGAFAVKDGKIVACGTRESCSGLLGPETTVVEQKRGLILPGMTEGHAHASSTGELIFGVSLYGMTTVEEYLRAIGKYIGAHPKKDVITGKGFLNGAFSAPGPTADLLDRISGEKAVVIQDFNGHTCWANSAALFRAGIGEKTQDPKNGIIVRYPGTSRPTGWLKETAMDAVDAVLPPYSLEDYKEALLYYQKMQLENGVTVSFEPVFSRGEDNALRFRAYHELEEEGRLLLTMRAAYTIYPDDDPDEVLDTMDRMKNSLNGEKFQMIALKIFVDGVAEGHTAFLREDYADTPGYRGHSMYPQEKLDLIVEKAMKRGYLVHTHAIGDAATDCILEAYEKGQKACGGAETRNAVTHLQIFHEDQIARMARLHVVAVPNPYWHWKDPVLFYKCEIPYLGRGRAEKEYPMKSLLDAGIVTAQASDYPVTVPPRAINSLHFMVNRKKPGDKETEALGPEECVSVEEGLRVLTWNGAYENRLESKKGSIEVGKDADFVVLDRDVLTERKEDVYKAKVLQTYIGGKACL
jgi:hypothetical protein